MWGCSVHGTRSSFVVLCVGHRKATRLESRVIMWQSCAKTLVLANSRVQHTQFGETLTTMTYPGRIWTKTSPTVAWSVTLGGSSWHQARSLSIVHPCRHSYHFVMKSTSSVCWDIWLEILHATWTLVAILVLMVLWAFRKVRSWCWRRQRPSQLFWNCNLGQKISWKHMVSRVCVLQQAEHGLFEFWWIRTDGTGLESLRGNRKERPMDQFVQMLTFKRLCCALTAQQLWDSWYAKVRVNALASWTRRSTLCKPGRWNLDNVSWRYMVTVNKLTTASQRLQLFKQLIAKLLDFDGCSNLSNIDEGVRKIAAHQNTASDMNTFCFPRRKRSSFGAFCSSSAEAIFASSTSKIWNSNSSYR